MKLLLDTHTYLWLLTQPNRVGKRALELVQSSHAELLVSVVSLVEISIKRRKGRVSFDFGQVEETLDTLAGKLLPLTAAHIRAFDRIEQLHKDPFDRLLVAQAKAEDAILLSADEQIQRYPCSWAWE